VAQQKKRSSGTSANTVKAKEAEAKAKQADAAAKTAEAQSAQAAAETRRLELEAERLKLDRADKRREEDASAGNQLRQVGLVAAPLAAGMAYGKHKADKIQTQVEKAAVAKNQQLDRVARNVRRSRDASRMKAAVHVVDKLKLAKMKGPIGGITAGFLVTEAVAARVVAANTENETAKEVLNAAAIGLGSAAVGTVGTRMVQRATSSVMPNAVSLVDIETARETLSKKAPSPATKAPKAGGGTLAKAGRLVLPALAVVVATSAFNNEAAAAESAGDANATARGSTAAAKALTDLLSFGAGEATERAIADGESRERAVAEGVAMGTINAATFGVATLANDALADQGGVSGFITDTLKAAIKSAREGKAFLNGAAERKAAQLPKAPETVVVAASAQRLSDGQTAGYTRRGRNGQSVQVKAYRTPGT